MASTEVNGNYSPQGYENSYSTGASNFTPSQQPAAQPAQQAPASEVPKDEVGWYFVEQYYTTLSKSPERLYVGRTKSILGRYATNIPISSSTTSVRSMCPVSRRRRSMSA